MQKVLIVLVFLLLQSISWATDLSWISNYKLTEQQVGLLNRWAHEEKFNQAELEKIAASFEKYNLKPKPYVPPHTYQQLLDVARWAEGGAFAVFAKYAGYTFDNSTYTDACFKNKTFNCGEIFNFGYATGTEFFRLDVLDGYFRVFNNLHFMYSRFPETFSEKYLELARARGFNIYLSLVATQ